MKANELMIGDWVRIDEPDKYAGATGQIQSLMYHREGDAAYFHVFIQGKFGYVLIDVCSDDIRPIPLEKIHLTKNGFKPVDEDDRDFIFSAGYRIEIVFDDGIPQMSIPPTVYMTIEFADKEIDMPIEYIHELQQAMRVMGCDKEIEL